MLYKGRIHKKIFNGDRRTLLIKKNIIWSFLIKGWSGAVLFLLVPYTIDCLGEYKNGVWLTVSSVLVWIEQMDIGLGNGLRNKIAACMAKKDYNEASSAIASTYCMLLMMILPISLLLLCLIGFTDIHQLLNVDPNVVDDLRRILIVVTALLSCTFVMKLIGNVYMGLQLPAVNNTFVTLSQTLILAGTVWACKYASGSLMTIAIINTAAPLLIYTVAYPITFYWKYPRIAPKRSNINLAMARELMTVGVKFFVLQMAGMVLFMSSNVIISKFFSPELVTPYNIAYRYFTIVLLLFGIISTPFWSATTDAYERNDIAWIRKSNKTLDRIMIGIFGVIILMILSADAVYNVWIGKGVNIPFSLTLSMSVYIFTLIVSLRYSCILNGLGKLRLQLIMTTIAAVSFIPLSAAAISIYDNIVSLVFVMCIVNMPGLIINRIQYNKLINNTARGIWNH